jgi:hypothetical protein
MESSAIHEEDTPLFKAQKPSKKTAGKKNGG